MSRKKGAKGAKKEEEIFLGVRCVSGRLIGLYFALFAFFCG